METRTIAPPQLRWVLIVGFALLALLASTQQAHARQNILDAFSSTYPASSSDDNASCQLCHGQSTSNWNEYGWGLRQNGQNFAALEGNTSININNGTTNLDEINASTQPGWTTGANNNLYDSGGLISSNATAPGGIGALDPAGDQPPTADPGGPYEGFASVGLTLDGSNSFDPDGGTITQYDWDFGDGNTGTGVAPSHTYALAGTYTVSLTVVDDEGTQSGDPATTTATISDTPPCVTTLAITTSEWTGKNRKLTVRGENTKKCGTVTVTNAFDPTQVLGTKKGNGPKFNINVSNPDPVPCAVQVEQDGVTVQADVANAPADCAPNFECIALGGLAYDSWHKSDAGGSGLPPDEPDADYTRCKACHGWDQQGTDGGYVRRSRNAGRANAGYQDPNNCDLPLADPLTCTPSRNISTDATFGSGSPIVIPAGGRLWSEGSAVFDSVAPWGPGAILGNRHPDLSAANPGGPTAQQLSCLTAFLNAPEARADQVFAAMDTSANPVVYTPVATADATAGEVYYGANCQGCHGAPDADSTDVTNFLPGVGGMIGYLNQDGKYSEFMHKMHWGIPNTSMTRAAMGDPTAADVADVVAYMQVLQALQGSGN